MNDEKKYPVGTRVKFIGKCKDCKGQVGIVVEVTGSMGRRVSFPHSKCYREHPRNYVWCPIHWLEKVTTQGEQLIFSFML